MSLDYFCISPQIFSKTNQKLPISFKKLANSLISLSLWAQNLKIEICASNNKIKKEQLFSGNRSS